MAIVVGMAVVLLSMGQPLWCKCGALVPFAWDIASMHNSQHCVDPYSFTHVLHGVLFCMVTAWLQRIPTLAPWLFGGSRPNLVVLLEAAWEILENTPMVIDRYRTATISLGYSGDSVINSIADVGACALGYLLARRLPVWTSVVLFTATELALVLCIRDSLLLNILMLTCPLDAVKTWQAG